jgi:hypothetical protein
MYCQYLRQPSEKELAVILKEFIGLGLMIKENQSYLSLAVMRQEKKDCPNDSG